MTIFIVEAVSGEISAEYRVVEVFTDKRVADHFLKEVQAEAERWNSATTLEKIKMGNEPSYDPYINGQDLNYIMYEMEVCNTVAKKGRK